MASGPEPEIESRGDPVFAGGGELGKLIRNYDWAKTPLGPLSQWPQSLRTAVGIILASRQPFWIGWGPELTYLYNDPYKSIIGGKHPWALGRPTKEVWSEIWADISPMLDQAMTGSEGTYVEQQLLIMERSGYPEETYYTFSYSPIRDDRGQPAGIICANTDDTARVVGAREIALLGDLASATAQARSRNEAIAAVSRVLADRPLDLPFSLIYWAEASGSFLLAGASGIEPGHPAAPHSIDFDALRPWPLGRVLRSAEPLQAHPLKGSAELPMGAWAKPPQSSVLLPLKIGAGGSPGVFVAALNPFRKLDARYRGFLGLIAGQIAAGISNAEAHAAERERAEKLAEIDRAKTQFFSNVSHEFRTPLTLLLSPVEQLLAQPQTEDTKASLQLARRNAHRLLRLVNSLLDLSRAEAGRLQTRYVATDLASFTAEVAGNFRSLIEAAGLALEIDCAPLSEPVYVDRDLWEKIIFNLLSNAYKFTFEGSIRVAVAPSADAKGVKLTVTDTGVGIPADELEHMFDRFHRVEGQKGRSLEGTGIGLALVREYVVLHAGEVEVESAVGEGSTFTVTLPFGNRHLDLNKIDVSAAQSAAPSSRAYVDALSQAEDGLDAFENLSPLPVPAGAARRARLLIAEDNADMRAYLVRLLSRDYAIITAGNGREALATIKADRPDLVLSDVMMPDLDGFGLMAALRGDPQTSSVPFILMSARAGEEARLEGIQAGADDYLTKPFSARELVARVEGSLRLSRARSEAASALGRSAAALARHAADLGEAQRLAKVGSWTWDAATDATTGSAELYRIFGLDPRAGAFPAFKAQDGTLYPNESWVTISNAMQETMRSGKDYQIDVPAFNRGSPIWISMRSEVMRDAKSHAVGLRGTVQDVTERKEAENRQRLLIDELNHRVKNTLAIVQSMVSQTLRENPDPKLFKSTFTARLLALSAAHTLLTGRTWQAAELSEIVAAALAPYRQGKADRARIHVEGPPVSVAPMAAIPLVLALHELATNAVKYGALSRPEGKLSVQWSVQRPDEALPQISLVWKERDGPPVKPPLRVGFGTRLIKSSAEQMGADIQIDYQPDGVHCHFALARFLPENSAP